MCIVCIVITMVGIRVCSDISVLCVCSDHRLIVVDFGSLSIKGSTKDPKDIVKVLLSIA